MHQLTKERLWAERPGGKPRFVWWGDRDRFTEEERTRYTGVYFIASAGFIKVGEAQDVEVRFRELNKMLPVAAERVAWIHMPLPHFDRWDREHTIHRRLKRWHVRGEWFKDCPEVRQFILKYGKPWPDA